VPAVGGGSSFDGMAYNGRAEEMPVLHRWHPFLGDPRFHRLLTSTVTELSDRIFGPVALPQPERAAA
jgi:hypothetical protein